MTFSLFNFRYLQLVSLYFGGLNINALRVVAKRAIGFILPKKQIIQMGCLLTFHEQ